MKGKKDRVKAILEMSAAVKLALRSHIDAILDAAEVIRSSLKGGGKVLVCGNGGSAADAQHFAAELVVKYLKEREALPAIALTVNPSTVTAASNDLGYDKVFARQVEAFGNSGDVFVAISTSGRSPNVNEAVKVAKSRGMKVVYLTGESAPESTDVDFIIKVPSSETPRIQEAHITILHIITELIES